MRSPFSTLVSSDFHDEAATGDPQRRAFEARLARLAARQAAAQPARGLLARAGLRKAKRSSTHPLRPQPDQALVRRAMAHHHRRSIPGLRSLMLVFGAMLLCKVLMLSALGFYGYDRQIARLSQGGALPELGGVIMQRDPLTSLLASQLHRVLR